MRAGQGFGRWGFVLGNVLIAFGAPVFVTSLVSTVAAGRDGEPARGEDVVAIVGGAAFLIAGLVCVLLAGRVRYARPLPTRDPYRTLMSTDPAQHPSSAPLSFGGAPVGGLSLAFNSLDDYYADDAPLLGGRLEGPPDPPVQGRASVPLPRSGRNSRAWGPSDRFCEPSVTGKRSTGTRRRPPAG